MLLSLPAAAMVFPWNSSRVGARRDRGGGASVPALRIRTPPPVEVQSDFVCLVLLPHGLGVKLCLCLVSRRVLSL